MTAYNLNSSHTTSFIMPFESGTVGEHLTAPVRSDWAELPAAPDRTEFSGGILLSPMRTRFRSFASAQADTALTLDDFNFSSSAFARYSEDDTEDRTEHRLFLQEFARRIYIHGSTWKYSNQSGMNRCLEGVRNDFEDRYAELLACAVDEKIRLKRRSGLEMRSFLDSIGQWSLPGVFLLDDGTFRLIWRNDDGEQIGLQFLGNGKVQYVIFIRVRGRSHINRAAGRHDLDALPWLLEGYEAWRLVVDER